MTVKLSMGIDQVNAEGPRRSGMPRETADIFAGSSMRGYLYGPPIEVAPHREPTFEEIRDTKYYPYGARSSSFTPVPGTKEIIRDIGVLAKPSSGAFHPNAFWDYQSYFNLNLQDPAYQAYTPPYFYGDSNYVLKFIPEDSSVGGGTSFAFEDVWSFFPHLMAHHISINITQALHRRLILAVAILLLCVLLCQQLVQFQPALLVG